MLFLFPPAKNQRCKHDACSYRGLCVLLADQHVELADQLIAGFRIVSAEYGGNEVEHPLIRTFTECWLAWKVRNAQLLEYRKRMLCLVRENGRRNNRLASDKALSPIGTSR